jgi:hypothetical protein
MSEKLFESEFERGIERYAEMMFHGCVGANAFEACLREHPDPTEAYMRLLDLDTRAKRARIWFADMCPAGSSPCRWSSTMSRKMLCAVATCIGTS